MDALTDVLRTMRLTGAVFLDAEFTEPWCVLAQVGPEEYARFSAPPAQVIGYHYVLEGRLEVSVTDGTPMTAGPGHLLLLPRNDSHILGSDLRAEPQDIDQLVQPGGEDGLASLHYGGGGARCRILCGYLGANESNDPLISSLPSVVRLAVGGKLSGRWIEGSIRYAARALADGGPGAASSLARMAELLFGEAIREYVQSLPRDQAGWLAGLRDPYVGRALALLHGESARAWTLDELSREAGLSRSALTERFSRHIGMPPMRYLTRQRLQRAARWLREGNATVSRVAYDVGYDSEAAFTRAFKREFGASPAAFRKAATAS